MPPDEYSALDERLVPDHMMALLRSAARAGEWPIYLFGLVGRGKSFVAANVFVRYSGTAAMLRYSDFIGDSIQAAKSGEISRYRRGVAVEHSEASWWRWLTDVRLLVIDEIGCGISHEWRNEMLWKLLEIRKGRPLILTGNLSPDELLSRFDDRIQSRILTGSLVELRGRDQRRDGLKGRLHSVSMG